VDAGEGASNHEPLRPDASSKEITLADIMNAIEVCFIKKKL
jgi:hypothetical protein